MEGVTWEFGEMRVKRWGEEGIRHPAEGDTEGPEVTETWHLRRVVVTVTQTRERSVSPRVWCF